MSRPVAFELACSANTLRFADLHTRVRAAASAGFTGIGLRLDDYRGGAVRDAELCALLAGHDLRILELEYTWDWAVPDPAPEERTMFRLADAVGYRQLNVVMFADHRLEELVGPFAALCDRAAEHGLLVGLEFMPYSSIRTIGQAWAIVAAAGRGNGGLIIDLWHWRRSGATRADLTGIPADRITSLQLCETLPGPLPDLRDEARHHRQLPGHGAGAGGGTATVVAALHEYGLSCPVSVEVFSDDLDALPAVDAARLAATTGREVLAEAGWPPAPPGRAHPNPALASPTRTSPAPASPDPRHPAPGCPTPRHPAAGY